jgi:hypothetical protein
MNFCDGGLAPHQSTDQQLDWKQGTHFNPGSSASHQTQNVEPKPLPRPPVAVFLTVNRLPLPHVWGAKNRRCLAAVDWPRRAVRSRLLGVGLTSELLRINDRHTADEIFRLRLPTPASKKWVNWSDLFHCLPSAGPVPRPGATNRAARRDPTSSVFRDRMIVLTAWVNDPGRGPSSPEALRCVAKLLLW